MNLTARAAAVSLDELAVLIGPSCAGTVIYFGSCSILELSDAQIMDLAKRTMTRAVVGYRKDMLWLDSAAFGPSLMTETIGGTRSDGFFNGLTKAHPGLAKRLGRDVVTRAKVHKA